MMRLIPGIDSTVSAMNAERTRLEIISQNIANANVTKTPEGGPYKRHHVIFEAELNKALESSGAQSGVGPMMVRADRIEVDKSPPIEIYDPTHPDADASGFVQMPNVNIQEEMVDMILASRSYEANIAAMKFSRSMAVEALSIGKS